MLALLTARSGAEVELRIQPRAGGFAFHLEGTVAGGPWVLQHTGDGKRWQDLLFFDAGGEDQPPGVEIRHEILAVQDAPRGFFRAVQLERADPQRRQFLTERARWRLSEIDGYEYELRQNFGIISWHGVATVDDGEVTAFETIDQFPPGVGDPEVPTIEDLFGRIASAFAQDAETIDITWHPTYGYPSSCFIDLSILIADEEHGWTVESFSP